MANPNIAAALPSTMFIPSSFWTGAGPGPVVVPDDSSEALSPVFDCSGFNTLSVVATVTGILGGDSLLLDLVAIDPTTGVATPSPIGVYNILTFTVDGSLANTLYLPAYYAANPTKIMPFLQNRVTLTHAGSSGDISLVRALFWLSNA